VNTFIEKYKGIHPGIILERLLNQKGISQRPFALSIDEYPQTINAISKGRRKLNTSLALKIEKKLNLEEGTLALLQTYTNEKIKEALAQSIRKPYTIYKNKEKV